MAQRQARFFPSKILPDAATAGIDEAGRGCLAGPVVAAAVIFDKSRIPAGLADSKKLSPAARARLEKQIRLSAMAWGLGVIWQKRIDEINILNASLEAMWRAVICLPVLPDLILVDGDRRISDNIMLKRPGSFAHFPRQQTIIGGDALVPEISAASILAKTFRDRLMAHLSKRYPGYGFEKHKGYGTKDHYAAIKNLGPCPLHRITFRGVKQAPPQAILAS